MKQFVLLVVSTGLVSLGASAASLGASADTKEGDYMSLLQTRATSFIEEADAQTAEEGVSAVDSPSSAQYLKIDSLRCPDHGYFEITTQEDCNAAATSFGLADTSAWFGGYIEGPGGCVFNNGHQTVSHRLYYDEKQTTEADLGPASQQWNILCTATQAPYNQIAHLRCEDHGYFEITTQEDCNAAASYFGLADTSAWAGGYVEGPGGCVFNNGHAKVSHRLYYDELQTTEADLGPASDQWNILCSKTRSPYNQIAHLRCPDHGYLQITSKEDCDAAAEYLGLADTHAWKGGYIKGPAGCVYNNEFETVSHRLYYDSKETTDADKGPADDEWNILCRAPGVLMLPTPSPTSAPATTTTTTTVVDLTGLEGQELDQEIEDEQIDQHECAKWCHKEKHQNKPWTGDKGKCNWFACSTCDECSA